MKLCVVLTNTRNVPLCKIRFDSDERFSCFILLRFVRFDKHSKLEKFVVSLSLLEYHLVIPNR